MADPGQGMRDAPDEAETIRREIVRRVAAAGPDGLGVHDYMELCLRGEGVGYYRRREVLGRAGDFVTAPEISQVFGELIGIWCVLAWHWMGQPWAVRLVEIGPGRGTMMADVLRALRIAPDLRQRLRVELIEVSETLQGVQQATLADCEAAITWSRLPSRPFDGGTILVANELVDALAIHQAVRSGRSWHARTVRAQGDGRLGFGRARGAITPPALAGHAAQADGEEAWSDGTITEWRQLDDGGPDGPDGSLAFMLTQLAGGGPFAGLLVDYGFDGPAPIGDTLQAVRGHRHVDPLESPGLADLSALVDFADLRRQLTRAGLAATASLTQSEFLGALGIGARAARLVAAAGEAGAVNRIESGVHRLLAPTGMGTRFRAIGVHNGRTAPPPFLAS